MFVSLNGVSKSYGASPVLRDCSLELSQGEFLTLLGPSGCGKSTLLRCIAGLASPDSGRIAIGGRDITEVPPNRREVGLVFQNYALFPHLSVARNVAYGLTIRGTPRDERERRTRAALELVDLAGYEDRWPRQLSGGQQQRVALARVLVLEPKVLLLDEPFGALDAKLRLAMQIDVKQLILKLGITTVFVTHDQDEALSMSDRIAVMRGGVIEQTGAPLEIYDQPANPFVADFIGLSNLLPGTAQAGRVALADGIFVPSPYEGPVTVLVRPENLEFIDGEAGIAGRISFVKHLGATTVYRVGAQPSDLTVVVSRESGTPALPLGTPVTVRVRNPAQCRVMRSDQ